MGKGKTSKSLRTLSRALSNGKTPSTMDQTIGYKGKRMTKQMCKGISDSTLSYIGVINKDADSGAGVVKQACIDPVNRKGSKKAVNKLSVGYKDQWTTSYECIANEEEKAKQLSRERRNKKKNKPSKKKLEQIKKLQLENKK